MIKIAVVFPGQGSQSVGMMTQWGDFQNVVTDIYAQASEALGYDLWEVVSAGPVERLNATEITQPAMLCAGVACWQIVRAVESIPQVQLMSGHSLGEYTALVCAESLDIESAVRLVAKRGELMQSAVAVGDGSMAVLIGLADEDAIKACSQVQSGIVEAVNFNAPGQVVIAGLKESVDEAMQYARALGAKRALPLPVSVPCHCSLLQTAADELLEVLESIKIAMPKIPVIHNQNSAIAQSVDEIRQLLKKQLCQPVKWVQSVQFMVSQGVECLVEFCPGKVLTGLTRRIDKGLRAESVFDIDSLVKTIQSFSED